MQYYNIMNNIHNAIGDLPKEDYWYSKKKKILAHILLKLRIQWQLNSKLYVTITQ